MNKKMCLYSQPYKRIKSYYEKIDEAVAMGFTTIEGFANFELETPDLEKAKEIREYLDKNNIKMPCFSVFVNISDNYAEKTEELKRYADVAKILGAKYLHHTIASEIMEPQKVLSNKEELFTKGINAVREIYDYAESIGVKTIFEEQGFIFNGVRGIGRFLDEVERDVGLVADFGNIYQVDETIVDFLKQYANRVMHVHIKDVYMSDENNSGEGLPSLSGRYMHSAKFGEGDVNIENGLRLLKEAGYDGYFGMEFGNEDDDSPIYVESLKAAERLLEKCDFVN